MRPRRVKAEQSAGFYLIAAMRLVRILRTGFGPGNQHWTSTFEGRTGGGPGYLLPCRIVPYVVDKSIVVLNFQLGFVFSLYFNEFTRIGVVLITYWFSPTRPRLLKSHFRYQCDLCAVRSNDKKTAKLLITGKKKNLENL